MRMDPQTQPMTAADIVNTYSEDEIARILREYGEERWASRIAAFIVAARGTHPITTASDLVDVIKAAIPASGTAQRRSSCPAHFQALRIEVNHELEQLERGVRSAIAWLAPQDASR